MSSNTSTKEDEDSALENGYGPKIPSPSKSIPFRRWVAEHFEWSWFTATQSLGGVAISLSECPKRFNGLQTIGVVIFIINLVLFLTFTSLLLIRWFTKPSTIKRSFIRAPECYFFGSFWLTCATIIICIQKFAVPHTGPWMIITIRVLFWVYAATTILSTTIHFVVMFEYHKVAAIEMNPAWFILFFNAMLTGTVAAAIAPDQPPAQRLPIIVAGIGYQGFGWMGSCLILAWFFGHLMEKGWPAPSMAPGLFMTVGSVGYTIVALIGNARALPSGYAYFADHPTAKDTLLIMATWIGVFLWIFMLWLFGIAFFTCLANVVSREHGKTRLAMTFNTSWWAFVFPNVGFTLATLYLGQELGSNAILWLSTAMIIVLVVFTILDVVLMIKQIVLSFFKDDYIKVSPA